MDSDRESTKSFKYLKPDVVLFTFQMLIIFIVVIASLYNLTNQFGNQNLWTVILTGSLGYIMPNPRIKSFTEDIHYNNNKK